MAYPTPLTDAKISYVTRDQGFESKAYINTATGFGTDKHTDIPIEVEWSPEMEKWYQVDKRQWFNVIWTDEWIEITDWEPPVKEPHVRRQPKKLSRNQRRKK